MLWKLYLTLAIATFLVTLQAFFRDKSVSKSDWHYWIFLLLVALCAPITLPAIVGHKIKRSWQRSSRQQISEKSTSLDIKSLVSLR
ncbi:MAG: hypothetical protein F6K04_14740 [Leptolyngbya sp. SIO4C5]|uniref:hypothetical protein n=1 Tax=Sphaerothrix gracilis TaxID=3151835 RepID=UPI0013C04C6E|nr:hypothetical protein [Leptolyngbya sp. SIO4C5]